MFDAYTHPRFRFTASRLPEFNFLAVIDQYLESKPMKKYLALWLCLGFSLNAAAQTPEQVCGAALQPRDAALHESCVRVKVSVKTLYGVERTDDMLVTHFKPDGAGPFPLAVMNHGRGPNRDKPDRVRYTGIARYWVQRGFAVLVPTRLSYGATGLTPDTEDSGRCDTKNYRPMMDAASEQVRAAISMAAALPWVDVRRVVVMGQSVGGFTSVAVSGKNYPGVLGTINFAGGSGGDPLNRPNNPCQAFKIGDTMAHYAKTARVPMLWLYAPNDKYWGEQHPKDWFAQYNAAGGKAQFIALPQVGAASDDGHGAISRTTAFWEPKVDAFIRQLGFSIPEFAPLPTVEQLPQLNATQRDVYQKFLSARVPRAMAIASNGGAGWASGDDDNGLEASDRALTFCNPRGAGACKVFAVDNRLVGDAR